jgi:hypothetical protein
VGSIPDEVDFSVDVILLDIRLVDGGKVVSLTRCDNFPKFCNIGPENTCPLD